MAALRELAGGWADLRAEVCGVMQGASESELHEPLARQAAELCRKARRRPGGDTKVDRRGPQAEGCRADAAVLWRPARRGSAAPRRSCGRYTVSGGCASVSSWKSPQDQIYPVQGT